MSSRLCVAASLVAVLASAPVAGQRTAGARLTLARTALASMKLDTAAATLRDILKSGDDVQRADRVEAWLLLGVVQFYQGSDSGTAVDFREALALEPGLRADGLANYDSTLVALFETQRPAAMAPLDCSKRGASRVSLPRLLSFPDLEGLPADWFDVVHNVEGALTLRFVVDSAGRVVSGTVGTVSSTLKMKELERAIIQAFPRAIHAGPRRGTRGAGDGPVHPPLRGGAGGRALGLVLSARAGPLSNAHTKCSPPARVRVR